MKVKSASQIKENYKTGAALAGPRYIAGVKTAEWQTPSIDGQTLYVARMQDPSILARRERGIAKVSDGEWREDAATKGGPIISQRMGLAVDKQASGWAPYGSRLEGLTLAARTADPATNVLNRVTPIAVALAEEKKRQKG